MKQLTLEDIYSGINYKTIDEKDFLEWLFVYTNETTKHFIENAISDEEIEKEANSIYFKGVEVNEKRSYKKGAKWLKQQLINKLKLWKQ